MFKKILLLLILIIPFSVEAKSTIVMDMDSNRILYSENIHDKRSVASISKVMTCIIAIESGKLYEEVEIGDEIDSAYGSGIYIQKGEKVLLIDLLYGLMLRSGNDAALAISNYVSSDFIKLMNDKAKEIGMKNTKFNNPSGLDINGIGNYSTAYDMALLTSYAYKNEIFRNIISTKKYSLKTNKNTYFWINKHRLLHSKSYVTGGKTGYTDIAKRTLITTASKNGLNLVVVTLNDGNDFKNHIDLLEKYFNIYTNYKILSKGNIKLISNDNNSIYYIDKDFYYSLDNEEKNNIKIKAILNKEDNKGILKVYLYDKEIYETNIIKIEKTNTTFLEWFRKLW